MNDRDRELGMDRGIMRRDILHGAGARTAPRTALRSAG